MRRGFFLSKIVYVLTNPAMPGLVKIGITSAANPQTRISQLYTTGVPLPFDCVIAVEVEDNPDGGLEKALHAAFAPYRINPSREFFEIDPIQVEAILRVWPGKDVTPQVNKEVEDELDSGDREAVRRFKSSRPNLNFTEMGIPVGSTLVSLETDEEATVIADKKVRFRGEEMSLTAATRAVLELDRSVAPTPHWTYNNRTLKEIYDETYESLEE